MITMGDKNHVFLSKKYGAFANDHLSISSTNKILVLSGIWK